MADFTLSAKITGESSSFQKAISRAEKSLGDFGKMTSKLGDKLTNTITKPALAAGTALAGITLVKGWNRLTALDNAKAKLAAIGNTAEDVEQIMNDALASVKGTAFGMDEAATTAASAVAAGIKPGKELQKYLTAVADAAAVAGTDMESMGAIFNKVATQGKANNEVLQQLAEKGIPIYQYLADETGKTAEEIFEMASRGEIDLATFQNAVETHISGAAVAMGDATLSGAIDNLMASISRIGANFLGASDDASTFGGQIRELLIDLRKNVLEPLEAKAADLGKVFGAWFAETVEKAKSFISTFKEINEATDGAAAKFAGIGTAVAVGIGPALKVAGSLSTAFGAFMGQIAPLSGKILSVGKSLIKLVTFANPVASIITILIGAFAAMFATNEEFRDSVMSLASSLKDALMPILPVIADIISQVGSVIASVVIVVLNELAPIIANIINLVSGIITALTPLISTIVSVLQPIIQAIITIIQAVLLPVITAIITAVGWLVEKIVAFITPIVGFIGGVISAIAEELAAFGETAGEIWDWIKEKFEAFSEFLTKVFSKDWSESFGFIGDIMNGFFKTISSIWNSIKKIFSGIIDFVAGAFTGNWEKAWNGIKSIFSGIWDGLKAVVAAPLNAIIGLINGVIGGLNKISIKIPDWSPVFPGKTIGFNIPKIPYLRQGTDDWQGGFAYMNEGGRGELVSLPNGAQVIPHDISVQYAKEAARANSNAVIDLDGIFEGVVINVYSQTNVDGTPLMQKSADYTIKKITNQQRGNMMARGIMI